MINIWLDDIRPAPKNWHHAYTYDDFVYMLKLYEGEIFIISFDHDLGQDKTGYDAVCTLEEMIHYGYRPPEILMIHTANPVGRMRIFAACKNLENAFPGEIRVK